MQNKQRVVRAQLNIGVSLLTQLVAMICGLIVPQMMISTFGSEAYGATTSIASFLAYITLLEGGIGGVARAALYKPLANNDSNGISEVLAEIQHFFRIIAYVFIAYVFVLAVNFKAISHVECFDWLSSCLLVIVISISTFMQYYLGITYSVLLQASQRNYVTQAISIFSTLLNTLVIIVLINFKCSLIVVKLVSSLVFASKPFLMRLYVQRKFELAPIKGRNKKLLSQKWTGLGQHMAHFLHSNTDIAVLTVFSNLKSVAIYSVYHMVNSHIQSLTTSFISGAEALFGDMIARKEYKELNRTFQYYETLISFVSIILFSVTASLIVPFVRVYTSAINDVNYIAPSFAFLLTFASLLYCLRQPYHSMTIAAGHFKQTKMAAYGEAIINIGLSIILVIRFDLIGVAFGTVCSVLFRFIYYVVYLAKNIMHRRVGLFVKRMLVNGAAYLIVLVGGFFVQAKIEINNYAEWALAGLIITFWAILIMLMMALLFYREDMEPILKRLTKNRKKG